MIKKSLLIKKVKELSTNNFKSFSEHKKIHNDITNTSITYNPQPKLNSLTYFEKHNLTSYRVDGADTTLFRFGTNKRRIFKIGDFNTCNLQRTLANPIQLGKIVRSTINKCEKK